MENTKDILEIISIDDAEEFKRMANGRKFCKVGERLPDICKQEIERYNYENSDNIFVKIFKGKKFKNNKNKFLIENRLNSNVRAVAADCVRNEEDSEKVNEEIIVYNVKDKILNAVNKYKENGEKPNL